MCNSELYQSNTFIWVLLWYWVRLPKVLKVEVFSYSDAMQCRTLRQDVFRSVNSLYCGRQYSHFCGCPSEILRENFIKSWGQSWNHSSFQFREVVSLLHVLLSPWCKCTCFHQSPSDSYAKLSNWEKSVLKRPLVSTKLTASGTLLYSWKQIIYMLIKQRLFFHYISKPMEILPTRNHKM